MAKRVTFPLKYKFLTVLVAVMVTGFSVFFYFAQNTFSEDKKLFVMDLNLTVLKAMTADIKLELRSRLDELQGILPQLYAVSKNNADKVWKKLPEHLKNEIIAITFYKKNKTTLKYEIKETYDNPDSPVDEEIESEKPLNLSEIHSEDGITLINRTLNPEALILTVVFGGTFSEDGAESLIAVDLTQDFLQKVLREQSEFAEVFLINQSGKIVSHPSDKLLANFSDKTYDHPIVERLKQKQLPKESMELTVAGEKYLCNYSDLGFPGVFAVSQIKKAQAFLALNQLLKETLIIGGIILCLAFMISIFFASSLTENIQKLQAAAQDVGRGNWDTPIEVESNDEVMQVADSFRWMANRLAQLMKEVAQKARMEEELKTAQLVQTTLLAPPKINSTHFDLSPYYLPASECGGDFWDVFESNNKITLVIGDATGHGAGAAIVTAVAKSCFSTLNAVFGKQVLNPSRFLTVLNRIICNLCKGELLVTMCIAQLNLETGELEVCNAGHESPFLLKAQGQEKNAIKNCETLFVRGERLGHSSQSVFKSEIFQLTLNDTLLLYTDGVSEAKNSNQKELGERTLKKLFATGGPRAPKEIVETISNATREHIGLGAPTDDITFVVFKWNKKMEPKLKQVGNKAA